MWSDDTKESAAFQVLEDKLAKNMIFLCKFLLGKKVTKAARYVYVKIEQ